MNKFILFKPVGLGKIGFFSNKNLMLFKQIPKLAKSAEVKPVKNHFLRSNIEILQSSLNPFKTTGRFFSSSTRSSIFDKGNVWKNYNKYYGNSQWDRLKGPAIFTALFCVGTTLLVPVLFNYTPLAIYKRSPSLLIYTIIGLNGLVFLMWQSPSFFTFLTKFGLLFKDKVYSNWSMLGSAFSHQSFVHILCNMFVLQSFGTTLCSIIGPANFLIMYLNSAVISSFISILVPTLARTSMSVGSLGASGAIFSVVGTFSYLIPKAPIALFFIPIPGGAWIAFLGSVAYNVAGVAFRWGSFDYAAHLGGSLAGVLYGWWYSKKLQQRRARVRHVGF
ncbi:rhomboid protein 1, mitochondrial [[Candida] jaroonii]|uniref:Rhomboid protein 1, mitochondrial n=1 Tax=[Candida] jaroonii TaxID=467808 RepID=A0ACA9YA01_9ASCO|nr:rhomboid protein 1, mitochondrial [[Candida] jaroonii]